MPVSPHDAQAVAGNLVNPPVPAIGVSAVIFDNHGKVCLVQRRNPPAQGFWHVPGGRLEAGESLVEACRREVFEETGLDVQIGPIMAVVERRQEGFHYIIIDFLATLVDPASTRCKAADDALDAVWAGPDELGRLSLAEGLLPILQTAVQARHGAPVGLVDQCGGTDFLALPDGKAAINPF